MKINKILSSSFLILTFNSSLVFANDGYFLEEERYQIEAKVDNQDYIYKDIVYADWCYTTNCGVTDLDLSSLWGSNFISQSQSYHHRITNMVESQVINQFNTMSYENGINNSYLNFFSIGDSIVVSISDKGNGELKVYFSAGSYKGSGYIKENWFLQADLTASLNNVAFQADYNIHSGVIRNIQVVDSFSANINIEPSIQTRIINGIVSVFTGNNFITDLTQSISQYISNDLKSSINIELSSMHFSHLDVGSFIRQSSNYIPAIDNSALDDYVSHTIVDVVKDGNVQIRIGNAIPPRSSNMRAAERNQLFQLIINSPHIPSGRFSFELSHIEEWDEACGQCVYY